MDCEEAAVYGGFCTSAAKRTFTLANDLSQLNFQFVNPRSVYVRSKVLCHGFKCRASCTFFRLLSLNALWGPQNLRVSEGSGSLSFSRCHADYFAKNLFRVSWSGAISRMDLHFPRSFEDLKNISSSLGEYKEEHYSYVLTLFCASFLWKQSFGIPGSAGLVSALSSTKAFGCQERICWWQPVG